MVGLASVAENKIKSESDSIQTVTKLNSEGSYEKSTVVVLVPEARDLGTKLAEIIGAEMTAEMPSGETKPDTDLLLIVGRDFQP
jgi:hypothetical protein